MRVYSARETFDFGKELAKEMKNGGVICLFGDLGAGKTTLISGLAEGLKINKRIISPTFVLMRNYTFGKNWFYHLDLYRLDKVDNLGFEELWQNPKNIIVIEWAERLLGKFPSKRKEIRIKIVSENEREIIYEDLY